MKLHKSLAMAMTFVVGAAWGQTARHNPSAGAPDYTKFGPWTRRPAEEHKIKKEVTEFLKEEDDLHKKADFTAMVDRIDFPVYMVTDNSAGVPKAQEFSRQTRVSPF